jgi:hypothetical protein
MTAIKMTQNKFENDLQILSSITGKPEASALFPEMYQDLLLMVKSNPDEAERYGQALKLRALMDRQLQYSMNQWLRADRERGVRWDEANI